MHAILILNAGAGSLNGDKDAATPDGVLDALRAAGLSVELRPAPEKQLADTLKAAVAERPDAIIVGGGDGTVSCAAHILAGTGLPLGVLPLGTLNHFAKDLGMPTDWTEAARALGQARPRELDVIEVNGRVFVNNCSIGSYAEAVRKRDRLRRERGSGKMWAMLLATLAVLRELRRLRARLEVDGDVVTLRTPFVVVANNRYSGHILDQRLRDRLDGGRLWIYTTHADRPLAVLQLAWRALRRKLDEVEGLREVSGVEAVLTVDARRPTPVAVDGELVDLKLPLRFRLRPRALTVLVPPPKP